ncbi:hypothetical protein F4809DRAFT_649215 [Biscogniauxia mediterranea]|nr:hypothetical protein F4809DRAFT_649215 [Biscogniauxia mediterranea]
MKSLKLFISTIIITSGIVSAAKPSPLPRGCGEVNVIYTGLPGTHRLVGAQGWDRVYVDREIKKAHKGMINAGYNVKSVLLGPEQDIRILAKEMDDTPWDITGIGFGLRGSIIGEIISRFEDIIMLYRNKAPDAPTVFNYNPESFVWSIQRRAPLSSDCAGSPGKDLGYEEICQGECQNGKDEL